VSKLDSCTTLLNLVNAWQVTAKTKCMHYDIAHSINYHNALSVLLFLKYHVSPAGNLRPYLQGACAGSGL